MQIKNIKFIIIVLILFLCLTYGEDVFATPFIPKSDSTVLEKLPKINLKQSRNKKFETKNEAIDFIKQCIELTRKNSDPRYLGYGEKVVNEWLARNSSDSDFLVLRGIVNQYNHNFEDALSDLSLVTKHDSKNIQAWLTKAAILETKGEYEEAKKCCFEILRQSNQFLSIACASSAGSHTGAAKKSYLLLKTTFGDGINLSKEEKIWALTILSDIAYRLGDMQAAESYLRNAINLDSENSYLLTVYSDFLIESGKPYEVLKLLKEKTAIDPLLLRLAIAEKKLGLPSQKYHIKELESRFQALHRREDFIHRREEALFHLKLTENYKLALKIAEKNWEIQKEPIDTKIFLEAAIKSNDLSKIKKLETFINKNKLEDINLSRLINKTNTKDL